MQISTIGACVLALAVIDQAAKADTISIISGRDNTLYQDANGAISNGAGEFFFSGNTAAGVARRGLLWFDVASALPSGAIVTNVTLTLHMSNTSGPANNVGLHRLLADWGEGISDAAGGEGAGTAAAPGDATWLHTFFNTSFWANAGGDFDASASAVTNVGAIGFYSWNSATMVSEVQGWLSNPSSNFGWLLKGDESISNSSKRFDTRESLTAEFRPTLVVDFTPVPAPGSLAVVAMAMFARRRRRAS